MNAIRMAVGLLLGVAGVSGCRDWNPVTTSDSPPGLSVMVLGQIDPGHPYVGAIIFDTPSPSWFPVAYQPWYCSGILVSRRVDQTARSEEHTSELQSPCNLVCRLLLEKKKNQNRLRYANMNAIYVTLDRR